MAVSNIAHTQISDSLYNALEKDLRPKQKNAITAEEAVDILQNSPGSTVYHYINDFKAINSSLEKQYAGLKSKDEKVKFADAIAVFYVKTGNYSPQKYWLGEEITNGRNIDSFRAQVFYAYLNLALVHSAENRQDSSIQVLQSALAFTGTDTFFNNMRKDVYYVSIPLYRNLHLYRQALASANQYLDVRVSKTAKGERYIEVTLAKAGIYNLMYAAGDGIAYAGTAQKIVTDVMALPTVDSSYWFQYCYRILGNIEYNRHNYLKAKNYYTLALSPKFTQDGAYQSEYIYKTQLYQGFCKIKLGDKSGVQQVLVLDIPLKDYASLMEYNEVLSQYYHNTNDDAKAFNYQVDYKKYFDSLNIAGQRGKVFEAEQKYAVSQKEVAITQLQNSNLQTKESRNAILSIGIVVALVLTIVALLLYIRNRQQQAQRVAERQKLADELALIEQDMQAKSRQLVAEKELAVKNNQKSISRNLHDELGSSLAALKYFVGDLKMNARNKETVTALAEVEEEVKSIYVESRTFIQNLAGHCDNANYDVMELLENLSLRFNAGSSMEVNINVEDSLADKLTREQNSEMYRVIKEAVANTLKHSGANRITIDAYSNNNNFVFSIKDNGKGTSQGDGKGIGIAAMRQRLTNLAGDIDITLSALGMEIKGWFPLARA